MERDLAPTGLRLVPGAERQLLKRNSLNPLHLSKRRSWPESGVAANHDATRRTKSVSTKVIEAEYDAIARRAEPLTVSEWARGILLSATQPDPLHFLLLAELLALRTIVLNLNFALAANDPPTTEAMHALIDRADAQKLSKAEERIARLGPGAQSTRR